MTMSKISSYLNRSMHVQLEPWFSSVQGTALEFLRIRIVYAKFRWDQDWGQAHKIRIH